MFFIFIFLLSTHYSWNVHSSDSSEEDECNKLDVIKSYQSEPRLILNNFPQKITAVKSYGSDVSANRPKTTLFTRTFSKILTKNVSQDSPLKKEDSPEELNLVEEEPANDLFIKKEYTPEELNLMGAEPTSDLFIDLKQSHGLNIQNIHERCWLLREKTGNGSDFSNLVLMLERSASSLAEKKSALTSLQKKRKPSDENIKEIESLESMVISFENAIERSLETISSQMLLEKNQLQHLLDKKNWRQKAKEKLKK